MTQAAIDNRISGTDVDCPFIVARKHPSVYNTNNFDVTWKSTLEPASTFIQPDGSYLPAYLKMSENSRTERMQRREQKAVQAANAPPDAGAFLSTVDFPFFVTILAFICSSAPTEQYSSPRHALNDPHSRFQTPTDFIPTQSTPHDTFTHHNSIIPVDCTDFIYAFITVALPSEGTPKTINEALRSVDARHWRFALDSEYNQLLEALTWEKVPLSEATNVVSGKWVFKIKRKEDGTIDRYKARWVARGFSQRHDVDYTEIFAPVIRYSSMRLCLSIANSFGLKCYGLDVSNAFARADVDELIYVEQPHGYVEYDKNSVPYVCKLNKGLYGTKQAARLWNQHFRKFLLAHGWRQLESDPCIFTRSTSNNGWEVIGLYVDDILHCCNSPEIHASLLADCQGNFPTTSQGELTWILSMRVSRDFKNKILTIDQSQSIAIYLEGVQLDADPKQYFTPMEDQWKYGSEPATTDVKEHARYRSECGSLMYFAQCTRPDISFAISRLCCHLGNPNANCFKALLHLNHYLSAHAHLGLKYTAPPTDVLKLEAYCDSSHGSEEVHKARSQTGYVVYFGGGPVDWNSSLQSTVAISSAEAEFIAAFHTSRTVSYFRELLEELTLLQPGPTELIQTEPTVLKEDNTACISMSKNPINHKRNRHIEIKYYYLRDLVENQTVKLEYVATTNQVADLLTKPVPKGIFQKLCPYLVRPIYIT